LVQVPEVWLDLVAKAYAKILEVPLLPDEPIVIQVGVVAEDVGTDGGVLLVPRYAKIKIKSPFLCVGSAIEDDVMDEPPRSFIAIIIRRPM
jgi:hypothetical protein